MKTPYVIIGIGKSGTSAQNLLFAQGYTKTEVFTFDEKNSAANFNQWNQLESLEKGTLIVSPGVPLNNPQLKILKNKGWQVTSEINLTSRLLTDEIVIGITGSVGKSTVTSLIGEAIKVDDPNCFVGGNLGTPFCDYGLRLTQQKQKAKYVVLELSSYQLENCENLNLNYSAITFLSANHLERYPSADLYYKTKCNIGKITKNNCIINSSSKDLVNYQKEIQCKVMSTNYNLSSESEKNYLKKSNLIGEHNLDNLSVAFKIAKELNLSNQAFHAMTEYKGLPHRLETVGLYDDTLYINDSKATAMDSVLVATKAALIKVSKNKNLYLLLGGKDKNLPWSELNILSTYKNITPLFFGHCGELAKQKSGLNGNYFTKLNEALDSVFKSVKPGDVVLLSPGGTSLDEFKNFEDRGDFFKTTVRKFYFKA